MNHYNIVQDNFFKNPEYVLQLASQFEYEDASSLGDDYRWTGQRTKCLSKLNYTFYNSVIAKVLQNYNYTKVNFKAGLVFQKATQEYNGGWVHRDNGIITFIIYLNKNTNLEGGTSFYEPNKNYSAEREIFLVSKKQESFKNIDSINKYEKYRLENNNQYNETIRVNNVFNRLVSFEGNVPHGANSYIEFDNNNPRLTLVGFVESIEVL